MGRGGRGDGYGGWGWGGWGGAEGAQWQHPGGQVGSDKMDVHLKSICYLTNNYTVRTKQTNNLGLIKSKM